MAEEYISVSEFRDYVERMTGTKNIGYGLEIYFEGFRLTGFEQALANAPRADVIDKEQYDGICLAYQRCLDRIRQIVGDNVKLCHKLKEFGVEDPYLGNSGYEINDFLNKDEKFVKYVEQNFTDTSANDFTLDKIEELYRILHKYKIEMEYKDKLISEFSNKTDENESK